MDMQATAGTVTTLIIADEALRMQPNAKTECASLYRLPKETGRLWQFNPYNNAVADIEGQWERDVKQLGPHDVFVAGQGESNAGVVFSVNHPIKNFKVLSLHFKEFKNDKPVFLYKELYSKDVFRPDRQLLVKFTFFGSIPNNGISYTDPTGKTRYYTVDASGKDGSLYFTEF